MYTILEVNIILGLLRYNIDTDMIIDGKPDMVGDVITKGNECSANSYYVVKIHSNQRKDFINYKDSFSGRKDIFNYVIVCAAREKSRFNNSYDYIVLDNEFCTPLYDFLKQPNLGVVDSVIMLTIR